MTMENSRGQIPPPWWLSLHSLEPQYAMEIAGSHTLVVTKMPICYLFLCLAAFPSSSNMFWAKKFCCNHCQVYESCYALGILLYSEITVCLVTLRAFLNLRTSTFNVTSRLFLFLLSDRKTSSKDPTFGSFVRMPNRPFYSLRKFEREWSLWKGSIRETAFSVGEQWQF